MIIKNTEEANNAVYSAIDIARRAEIAVKRHPKFFNSDVHQSRVNDVVVACRNYLFSWEAIYVTARPASRIRKVHTEVKFNKIQFPSKGQELARKKFTDNLQLIGINSSSEVIYKPNTNSISILVF